jgi:hypothetical protein
MDLTIDSTLFTSMGRAEEANGKERSNERVSNAHVATLGTVPIFGNRRAFIQSTAKGATAKGR